VNWLAKSQQRDEMEGTGSTLNLLPNRTRFDPLLSERFASYRV
jgi:hypothetical protein